MLKAGALYFSIVVAFFIAIITASLIMLAAHFRASYLKDVRYNRLLSTMNSGIQYLLADGSAAYLKKDADLFDQQTDSVVLERKNWGIYELNIVMAHIQSDTLSRFFLSGTNTVKDTQVLYLSDEDRPLSVSGNTRLVGDAALPKSGIKQAYTEGKPYTGDKRLLEGKTTNSKRTLKDLNSTVVKQLETRFKTGIEKLPVLDAASIHVSFRDSTQVFRLMPKSVIDAELEGNIILVSDSSVTISAMAKLNHIQIYAHAVTIEKGFKGNCQIFVRDSIIVKDKVEFTYPSVLGILRAKGAPEQPAIICGKELKFNGILFSYEAKRSTKQMLIGIGKGSRINGEIYSTGFLKLDREIFVAGKVSCNRFMMQTPVTLYENFLIGVTFNRKARSRYYLSSKLFEEKNVENNVLQWLN